MSFIVLLVKELRIGAASLNPVWSALLVIVVARRSVKMLRKIVTEGFIAVAETKNDQHESFQESGVFVKLTVCCLGS